MEIRSTELNELARAIWCAAYGIGYSAGRDKATAEEWGDLTTTPQTAEAAWDSEVAWRLEKDSCRRPFNMADPESWMAID